MEGLFGSTNSLGGLLTEDIFNEGEADQFLQELGTPVGSKGFEDLNNAVSSSGNSCLDGSASTRQGDAITGGLRTSLGPPPLPSSLPLNSAPGQAWLQTQHQPAAQPQEQPTNGLALLSQLLGALQPAQPPAQQQQQQQSCPGLVSQLAAAFKPNSAPAQTFTPVSQVTASATQPVSLPIQSPTLPNLNAQQQAALQTIMSFGQIGNTVEGKKVRRMLSNRESARRSRHRKQAHVSALEERASKLEVENAGMQQALIHAAKMEADAVQERARLYADLATLRNKVALLEGSSTNTKAASKPASTTKRGHSHGSSAANASEDSCCDSMPAPRPAAGTDEEPCCKRCRAAPGN